MTVNVHTTVVGGMGWVDENRPMDNSGAYRMTKYICKIYFTFKFQATAEKTAKNYSGIIFATSCTWLPRLPIISLAHFN